MNTAPAPVGVRAVVFDISGTVLDYGSRAPLLAFVELFARHGVTITAEEARRPMGLRKADHVRALLDDPAIAARWAQATGAKPSKNLAEKLYATFGPLQAELIRQHCDIIPGVLDVVHGLRARGIKFANTTGFDSLMMASLKRLAEEGGYKPDLWICPDDVGQGRPAPWMIFHAARQFDIYPLSTFVKVGDTPADIAEAQAAGAWCVSVVTHGNEVGLSQAELAALPQAVREERIAAARARLTACGPHYVLDCTADLLPVIDEISARINRGEKP